MNITVVRDSFVDILQKAAYFTSVKLTELKVFRAVLLEAKQNTIVINTTNVSDFFSGEIGGKVFKTGGVLVDLKTLLETVKNLNDNKISLEKKNNQLIITGLSGQIKLVCLEDDNFPSLEKLGQAVQMEKEIFKEKVIQSALSSCATDETRPILTGVCLDFKEKEVVVVGTDGFRLSLQRLLGNFSQLSGRKVIISGRGLSSVLKVFKKLPFTTSLTNAFDRVIFESGNLTIVSKTIEGEYPPYEKVIPQDSQTKMVLKTKDFFEAVRASSLLAKEGSGVVSLVLNNKELLLTSVGAGIGEARFRVEPVAFSGKDNKIVFNYRYLLDFLNGFGEDEVVFEMSSALTPGVFKGQKNNQSLHIIMPIRSQE